MTETDVRRWLEEYKAALTRLEYLQELYETLFAAATSCSVNYSGGASGGGDPGDPVGNAVCALDEIEEKIRSKEQYAETLKKEITDWIENISDPMVKDVLYRTYILDQDRSLIAMALKCGRQTVTNKRRRGIQELAVLLN